MDTQSVYTVSVLQPDFEHGDDRRGHVQGLLEQFILQFLLDNTFVYRLVVDHSSIEAALNHRAEIKFARMFSSNNTTAMSMFRISFRSMKTSHTDLSQSQQRLSLL